MECYESLHGKFTELVNYNLDLVAVQEVRSDKGGSQPADGCTFFCGNGTANYKCSHISTFINTLGLFLMGKHNQVVHVLIKGGHSNIVDILSFRGADCDTNNHLTVTKFRQRLSVSKRAPQKF
jgi:hypothetical protein